jgi:uncharacterized protein (DUF2336 family)
MEPRKASPSRPAEPHRERLLEVMAQTCAAAPRAREPAVRDRLGEVFAQVLAGADTDTRRRFAARIAADDWVSPDLALQLAKDRPEVAGPLLASSPALGEPELRHLLETGSAEHRAAVARRKDLAPRTAEAIADTDEPLALAALAANGAVELPSPVLRRLVEASRTTVALRAPLARRADLGAPLARMMAGWVGEDLRTELAGRFALDGVESTSAPEDEADARLVRKLEAADQLRPGFLLRTLREGRLGLFRTALAALGGFTPAQVTAALAADSPDLLALACVAAGVDRSAFPTLLALVRELNDGAPPGDLSASLPVPAEAAELFRGRVGS